MLHFKTTKIALATSVLAIAGLSGCSSNKSAQSSENDSGLISMKNETQQENRGADKAAVYASTDAESTSNQQAQNQNQNQSADQNQQNFGSDVEQMSPITQTVSFEFDSAELTPEAERTLRNALEGSEGAVAMEAEIIGYADAQGPEDYNMNLSEQRAQSVREFISGLDTNISEWEVEGRGEQSPASSNNSEWGRAQNRRVSITLKPAEQVSQNTEAQ